ncbi:MAG: hypothetical protein IKP89_00195 [Bacteroidales bacterium]|nr:hypothetical protein [Bacteroidales bacterium]
MKASLFKRSIVFLADLSAAHLCAYALLALFAPPFETSNITFIWLCVGGYFLTGHLLHGCSLFQYLFHLAPQGNRGWYILLKTVLVSVAPVLCSLLYRLPAIWLWDWLFSQGLNELYCVTFLYIGMENARLLCALVWFIMLLIAETVCMAVTKKSLCERICGTEIVITAQRIRKPAYFIPLALLLFLIIYEPVRQQRIQKNMGFKAYNAMPVYPPTPWLEKQRYARSFRACQQQPEEYLMRLFDQYDILFLVEREHPDCLQWDFFTRFILSEAFAEKIGSVSIETADRDMQPAIDTFLNSDYPSDTAREKAAAHIIRECSGWPTWYEKSLFDFFVQTNLFNRSHDSLHQIRICACDMDNAWDRLDTEQLSINDLMDIRDSIMGNNVVKYYQEQTARNPAKNKMLAIFNDIHCYRKVLPRYKSTIDHVDAAFPQRVGVCNLPSATYYINGWVSAFSPEALWYSAAREVGDCFAIPVKGSILENKHLKKNLSPRLWGKRTLQELFDGILFAGHPQDYVMDENGYPFMFDPEFEKEFAHRCELSGLTDWIQESLDIYYGKTPPHDTHNMTHVYFNRIYIMVNFIVVSMLLLTLIFFGKQMLKVNTTPVAEKP